MGGIGRRLDMQGKGIFKFSIKDNKGRVHIIRIPNSLNLHELRQCLLSPQHWVHEAGDGQTWMGNFSHNCMLNWNGRKKTVPFDSITNMLIFFTASEVALCPLLP
jgi:hypothetical protein